LSRLMDAQPFTHRFEEALAGCFGRL
jgi:hypothetical protein